MTYDTDDLTIDDLDDKVFDAAKALFAAIQFSATVQDNRQHTKAEIIASAIEWVRGHCRRLVRRGFSPVLGRPGAAENPGGGMNHEVQ